MASKKAKQAPEPPKQEIKEEKKTAEPIIPSASLTRADTAQLIAQEGEALLADIFRRADKNDDGKLSFDEFCAAFQDQVLPKQKLRTLFDQVDQDSSGFVSPDELRAYFLARFSSFGKVFVGLETLGQATTTALHSLAQIYSQSSELEQFVFRFFLRELMSHIEHIHKPVAASLDALSHQTLEKYPNADVRQHPQHEANAQKHAKVDLVQQVNKLADIVARFDLLVNGTLTVALSEHDTGIPSAAHPNGGTYTVVNSTIIVSTQKASRLLASLQAYFRASSKSHGYVHMYVQRGENPETLGVWEIWNSVQSHAANASAPHSKSFAKTKIDLAESESTTVTQIPVAFWHRP